jgi:maleylpyruvate isomerase
VALMPRLHRPDRHDRCGFSTSGRTMSGTATHRPITDEDEAGDLGSHRPGSRPGTRRAHEPTVGRHGGRCGPIRRPLYGVAMMPAEEIEGVRAAHARLHETLAGLDDATARRPSRLPGWTVGHVLTHLARNADSVVRRLAAAAQDRLIEQYEGGDAGRNAAIEAGADRPAEALVADLTGADEAVERLFATLPETVWDRPVLRSGPDGGTAPAARLAYSRWREVEVHHVDLGLGYEPERWPAGLVERMLPDLLAGLPDRTGRNALAAWALDRAPAPRLSPWE